MSSQHPLDRDPDDDDDEVGFDFSSPQSGEAASPDRTLLKLSVRGVVVLGVLVFLSSVAVNNLQFGSSGFQVAYFVSRVMMGLLLLSFVGVLLAYRLPSIRRQLGVIKLQPSSDDAAASPNPVEHKTFEAIIGPMGWLVGGSIVAIILAWATALMANISLPVTQFVISAASALLPGLLIAMIVWNRGCVRAYAIGALSSYVISSVTVFQPISMFLRVATANAYSAYSNQSLAYTVGIHWTTIVVGGIIPAMYIWLLEKFSQSKQ